MKIEHPLTTKFIHVAYDIDTGIIHGVAANAHYLFDQWNALTNEERVNFGVATLPNNGKSFIYKKIEDFISFR